MSSPEDTQQDRLTAALIVACFGFAGAAGTFALVASLLTLLDLAAQTAGAIAAAGIGASVSIPLARRGGK